MVYVPYATSSDVVNITYNSIGVVASSSATHITYQPPFGTSIKIKEHVEVKATAHGSNGNTVSCNFTYEATSKLFLFVSCNFTYEATSNLFLLAFLGKQKQKADLIIV